MLLSLFAQLQREIVMKNEDSAIAADIKAMRDSQTEQRLRVSAFTMCEEITQPDVRISKSGSDLVLQVGMRLIEIHGGAALLN